MPDSANSVKTKLSQAQELMARFVMRPLSTSTEVETGEPYSVRDSDFDQAADALFKPSWSLKTTDRLEIYNRQYWYRVLDSLLEDFPALQIILGAEKFDALITEYVKHNPSNTYTLRDLGYRLPQFILERPELTEPDTELSHQMAAFEWAAIEAFDRKRYPTLPPNAMTSGNPELLVLKLQPYISIIESDYALDDFAIKVDKESAQHGVSTAQAGRCQHKSKSSRPKKKKVYLVVHRIENAVYYKRIDLEQFCLLTEIQKGATLGDACEALVAQLSPAKLKTLPTRLQQYFAHWMEFKWFADPTSMK